MKRWTMIVMAGWLAGASVVHAEYSDPVVPLGVTMQDVVQTLGVPEGLIRMGNMVWLTYARGTVKLEDDRVIEAELISTEAALARRELEAEARQQAESARAEAAAQRTQQGWEIKNARLSDSFFLSTPASYQVSYWQNFQRAYPGVSVGDEYRVALARAEQEEMAHAEKQMQEQRIRDLEDRVAQAERENNRRVRVYYNTPAYVYWPTVIPVVSPVAVCRTPVVSPVVYSRPMCGPAYSYGNKGYGTRITLVSTLGR